MTEQEQRRPPRLTLAVSEMIVIIAVTSTLATFLLGAVNAAREIHGQPPVLPFLVPLYTPNPWPFSIGFPALLTTISAICLVFLRRLLPEKLRSRFPLMFEMRTPAPPEPIQDSRPALVAAATGAVSTGLLILAATHVRADRTNRRPVVTWEGPLADYAAAIAWSGCILSVVAIGVGCYAIRRFRSRPNALAHAATFLGCLNLFGSFMFYCAVTED